jgi:hypothetical protein
MAFKLYECDSPDGLPLVEVPGGKYVYERLSPGTIAEADYYKTFRWVSKGRSKFANILVAKSKADPDGPMRLLRIRHTKKGLKKLLRDCKSGKLAEKRSKDIERIQDDMSALGAFDPEGWHWSYAESYFASAILIFGGAMLIVSLLTKPSGGKS